MKPHLVQLIITVEGDVEAPAGGVGGGVGEPNDQPEHGAEPKHLGGELDGLLRVAGHRVGTGLQGGHVGSRCVKPQLVQVMLEHPMHQHRVVPLPQGLVHK